MSKPHPPSRQKRVEPPQSRHAPKVRVTYAEIDRETGAILKQGYASQQEREELVRKSRGTKISTDQILDARKWRWDPATASWVENAQVEVELPEEVNTDDSRVLEFDAPAGTTARLSDGRVFRAEDGKVRVELPERGDVNIAVAGPGKAARAFRVRAASVESERKKALHGASETRRERMSQNVQTEYGPVENNDTTLLNLCMAHFTLGRGGVGSTIPWIFADNVVADLDAEKIAAIIDQVMSVRAEIAIGSRRQKDELLTAKSLGQVKAATKNRH